MTFTMSRLFANISKAGVESDPRLLEVFRWRETHRRADQTSETHADSGVIERSVSCKCYNYYLFIYNKT